MLFWIYDYPTLLIGLLFCVVFICVHLLGVFFIRPKLVKFLGAGERLNDFVGQVLSLYSVMYGLLLGMLAVVTFQNMGDAQKITENEAAAVAALFRDVSSFPTPHKETLQSSLYEYTRYVIEEAWPLQRRGIVPTGGVERVDRFQYALTSFEPQTKAQEALLAETLSQYNSFVTIRRMRLNAVSSGIPGVIWQTVGLGSLISMGLIWMLDSTVRQQVIIGSLAAFATATMIGLVALMDHPFRGELSVSADAFRLIYHGLMKQ
jgi:hypothetical protein